MKTMKILPVVLALFMSLAASAQKAKKVTHTQVQVSSRTEARVQGVRQANANANENAQRNANENSVLNGTVSKNKHTINRKTYATKRKYAKKIK
ncbi:MAG: hypothetical protein EON98_03905 [Chitinophagaceae bacterium]|nr:MAG: hypothetical protein EON98_03905 [Chitinophagaceae bacterium]